MNPGSYSGEFEIMRSCVHASMIVCAVLELWKGRDEGCMETILTTLPWIRHVSAHLLEDHPPTGRWNLHLHTKWPSKLHAAPRTCDAVTQTHCCPLSRSSVDPARSALKCKACAVNEPLGCTHSLQPPTSMEYGSPREPTLHVCFRNL